MIGHERPGLPAWGALFLYIGTPARHPWEAVGKCRAGPEGPSRRLQFLSPPTRPFSGRHAVCNDIAPKMPACAVIFRASSIRHAGLFPPPTQRRALRQVTVTLHVTAPRLTFPLPSAPRGTLSCLRHIDYTLLICDLLRLASQDTNLSVSSLPLQGIPIPRHIP